MRKFYLLLILCMSASVLSAEAQISLKATPDRNAKLTLSMLTQHSALNGETFNNAGQVFINYFKALAVLNEDKTLSPGTLKNRLIESAPDLDAQLKAVLNPEQVNTWLNIVKPDVQKQLQNN